MQFFWLRATSTRWRLNPRINKAESCALNICSFLTSYECIMLNLSTCYQHWLQSNPISFFSCTHTEIITCVFQWTSSVTYIHLSYRKDNFKEKASLSEQNFQCGKKDIDCHLVENKCYCAPMHRLKLNLYFIFGTYLYKWFVIFIVS